MIVAQSNGKPESAGGPATSLSVRIAPEFACVTSGDVELLDDEMLLTALVIFGQLGDLLQKQWTWLDLNHFFVRTAYLESHGEHSTSRRNRFTCDHSGPDTQSVPTEDKDSEVAGIVSQVHDVLPLYSPNIDLRESLGGDMVSKAGTG